MTDHAITRRVHTENQGLSGSQLTRPSCLPLNPMECEKFIEGVDPFPINSPAVPNALRVAPNGDVRSQVQTTLTLE